MPAVTLFLLLVAPIWALSRLASSIDPWILAGLPLSISVFCYAAIRSDKARAKAGQWRTPEAALHLGELLGGWPGSFIAQWQHRHKTAKASYQAVFWLVVLVHQLVAIDYIAQGRWSRLALAWFADLLR